MGAWFKQFESLIWAASLGTAVLAYCYSSFATIKYVDVKHESVMEIMHEVQNNVREIRKDVQEIARKKPSRHDDDE